MTFLIVAFLIIVNFLINRYKKSASYAGVDKANFIGLGAYTTKQYFFSYNELEFYNLVSRLLLEESFWKYDIFPKVRLLDLANPNSRFYKNKIAQKHIDFLIVDRTQHCTPILAIELNGHSHETQKMEERDEFV